MKVCQVCSAAFVGDYVYCPRDGTRLHVQGDDRMIGKSVDRFTIEERIGDGRLGRAYRARLGEKLFAVKVLIGDLSADRAMVQQFRQSAHLLSKVRHPNVSEVVEFDTTSGGLAFIASNFLPGQSLASLIRSKAPLTREVADGIVRDLAEGLAAAHAVGLVYRDLRPETVRVEENNEKWRATIADFSLTGLRPRTSVLRDDSLRNAAPECLEEHVGAASDLYSLGVILADMIEGGDAEGHPLLPLLLHRLPEGRLKSAEDVLEELGGSRPRRAARTDDLELVESTTPSPAPIAEWASHVPDPPDPVVDRTEPVVTEQPDEPEIIEIRDDDDIVEVVVGDPEQAVPWPMTQSVLAELLVEKKIINRTDHDAVLEEVAKTHHRFLQVLHAMRPKMAERATKWLIGHLKIGRWSASDTDIHPRVLATIPKALATELGVVPFALRAEEQGNTLFVAVSDPVDKPTRQAIEAMVHHPVVWAMASPEDIDGALEAAYGKEVRQGVPATMRIRRPKM